MTQAHDLAIASAQNKLGPACELSAACELVMKMRQAMDVLQHANQQMQLALAELDHLAGTDKLTGAWNRRRLEEAVGNEMDRLKRYGHPLSLLLVDVDWFKRVNDHYGHAAGDRLLVDLAARIRSALRNTDSLTRWGGEEFVVLCPDTALATAAIFAERLRAAVAQIDCPEAEKITVSIGAAECLPGETWEQWFGRADAMLLEAKAAGRNRVRVASEVQLRAAIAETDPANFLRLVWQQSYACGHELLDREHRTLFCDANDLLAAALAGRPADETGAIADKLMRDVTQHFRDEELIIAAAGYPGAAKHAAVHRKLVDRAQALVGRFRAGEADVGELFQLLAHEVVAKHMLGADRDFFPYLQGEQPRAAPALPA